MSRCSGGLKRQNRDANPGSGERIVALEFFLTEKVQFPAKQTCRQTEEEEVMQPKRMEVMRRMMRRKRTNGVMDAQSSRWVTELLAADCKEKVWVPPSME